jgi:hypothetical protein
VEQDGAMVSRINVVTTHDGQIYNSWFPPWPSPHDWNVEVDAFLRTLEQQWPTRAVGITFIALSKQGETIAQLPHSIQGQKKNGALSTGDAALGVGLDAIAVTIEKLQRLTNSQLDSSRRTLESQSETIHQLGEIVKLYRQREILEGQGESKMAGFAELIRENPTEVFALAQQALDFLKVKGG